MESKYLDTVITVQFFFFEDRAHINDFASSWGIQETPKKMSKLTPYTHKVIYLI